MKRRKIFNRLMEFRAQAVRGNEELDQYFDLILADVGRVLGLSPEDCAALRGSTEPREQRQAIPKQERPPVREIEIGQKLEDGAAVFRFLRIYGDPDNGYSAIYEENFIPAEGGKMELCDLLFSMDGYPTIDAAIRDAIKTAITLAIAADFTITV